MMTFLGLDLNSECGFCDPAKHHFVGATDEPRQAGVCAADATSSVEHLPPLRHPLSGRVQSEVLLVPGSVSVHGLRAVDLSGEPSGHRSMPARPALQTLSSRDSRGGGSQYAGQCQCHARLAHLRRFRQSLIGIARPLYAQEPFGVDLQETVYALDTTTIDLCLSVFPWAFVREGSQAENDS
jgi:hypothetical protein